jgi:hypothetical protein
MSLLCKIGLHKWETIKERKCKATVGRLYPEYKIDALAMIQKCKDCHKKRGIIDSGVVRQVVSVSFLEHNMS